MSQVSVSVRCEGPTKTLVRTRAIVSSVTSRCFVCFVDPHFQLHIFLPCGNESKFAFALFLPYGNNLREFVENLRHPKTPARVHQGPLCDS